jgi:hypothetical protein
VGVPHNNTYSDDRQDQQSNRDVHHNIISVLIGICHYVVDALEHCTEVHITDIQHFILYNIVILSTTVIRFAHFLIEQKLNMLLLLFSDGRLYFEYPHALYLYLVLAVLGAKLGIILAVYLLYFSAYFHVCYLL